MTSGTSSSKSVLNGYKALEHASEFAKQHFVVNWTFFNLCNFSCSYCTPQLYDGSHRGVELATAKRFVDNVIQAKPSQTVFFEFTGGEITHYPHFTDLFTYIKERGGRTGIISNGSKPLTWWELHASLIDHACLSFHAEKGNADNFYDVVTYLHKRLTLHVNIMMLPEQFDALHALGEKIAATVEGVSLSLQPLFNDFTGPMYTYSPEQRATLATPLKRNGQLRHFLPADFQKLVFRGEMKKIFHDGESELVDADGLVLQHQNIWLGWDCMTGVENIKVTMEGSIKRGTCGMGGIIGHVSDEKLQLPTSATVCLKKVCACPLDIMSTKYNRFS